MKRRKEEGRKEAKKETEYHRLGGLSSKHLFLILLEAGKAKAKVLANLVPGEGSLPGFQTARCLLAVLSHGGKRAYVSPISS